MSKAQEILEKISSKESSKWVEKAKWRIENERWLDKSAKIALMILRTLREKGIKQVDLAAKLGITPQQISKIVKGQENLTLETISKIEAVLGVELIELPAFSISTETKVNNKLYAPNYRKSEKLPTRKQQFLEMKKPISCKIYDFRKDAA